MQRYTIQAAVLAMSLSFGLSAWADDDAGASGAAAASPYQLAWQKAAAAAQHGPTTITLRDQAQLKLPQGYQFIPKAQAKAWLETMGNQEGDELLGVVVSEEPEANWMVVAEYQAAGYVKDDDARDWNADELLKSLQEGTEAGNKERRQQGFPEWVVTGWVEKPAYDAKTHRLVWSAALQDKKPTADSHKTVNYNTYALGREGYISLNLVTDLSTVDTDKAAARELLSDLDFNAGKRYQDFNSGTDKVAEYGLAALVGGVALKKLGLLAVIGAFLAKGIKLVAVAVVGGLAAIRKLFGRKGEDQA